MFRGKWLVQFEKREIQEAVGSRTVQEGHRALGVISEAGGASTPKTGGTGEMQKPPRQNGQLKKNTTPQEKKKGVIG